jgi:MSHA pilin protein MshC
VNRGYTLIELVVTISIMAILAAIAVPLFNQPQVDATWFREQVKSAVRYAQRQAVAQRRPVFVVVTASTNTVKLCYVDASCAAPVPQLTTGTAYILTAPSGVTLVDTSFWFNGLGQPSPLAGISFNVGSQAVIVNAETGYVQ